MKSQAVKIEFDNGADTLQIVFDSGRGQVIAGLKPSLTLVPSLSFVPSKGYRTGNTKVKIEFDRTRGKA
jgi:hypothetical protein